MRISRRPKRRASTENAPGPSKAIATARMVMTTATELLNTIADVSAPHPMITAAMGVRRTSKHAARIGALSSQFYRIYKIDS